MQPFIEWLKNNTGLMNESIKKYANAIKTICKDTQIDILDVPDYATFQQRKNRILNHREFKNKNLIGNHMYSSALNYYDAYLSRQNPSTENYYIELLKNADDIDPYKHDGSYELVQTALQYYHNIPLSIIDGRDLDVLYFLTIGTWKRTITSKKELVLNSHLLEDDKESLCLLLDQTKEKANNGFYENSRNNKGQVGMFGTGIGTYQYLELDVIHHFFSLCLAISEMEEENDILDYTEKQLQTVIYKGFKTGSISQVLHCLKPTVFPIINGNQGQGAKLYEFLNLDLINKNEPSFYIENTRKIKDFRDQYTHFKNYRVMDLVNLRKEDQIIKLEPVYWWLVAIPREWKFLELEDHETIVYNAYTEKGNKKRIFSNFEAIEIGDYAFLYETAPTSKVLGLCKVVDKEELNITFQREQIFENPITYKRLRQIKELEKLQFFQNMQISLGKVTKEEANLLLALQEGSYQLSPYNEDKFLEEIFIEKEEYHKIKNTLLRKKNIILQGPPGIGKTFWAKKLFYSIIGREDESNLCMVQFHQSYSYEEFIQGFRPSKDGTFSLKNGPFYQFVQEAMKEEKKAQKENREPEKYGMIIDEINRGNLSKIFGECFMLIEENKRSETWAIPLTYSEEEFYIPSNVYLIGTMNTADRSLALVDYALRRRFAFMTLKPAFSSKKYQEWLIKEGAKESFVLKLTSAYEQLNDWIAQELEPGFQIGHSYFMGIKNLEKEYPLLIEYELKPLLEEYFYDAEDQIKEALEMVQLDENKSSNS